MGTYSIVKHADSPCYNCGLRRGRRSYYLSSMVVSQTFLVTYMSPVEAFPIAIKMFGRQKLCLIAWSFPLRLLIAWFARVNGQIAAARSWFADFSSSEATLIPWLAPKKGLDCLIQFWSWSQMFVHGTYKWLPLALQWKRQRQSECKGAQEWPGNKTGCSYERLGACCITG